MRTASVIALFALAQTCSCAQQPKVPSTVPLCSLYAIGGPPLVYPIPGATNVPTGAGFLVFAGPPIGADLVAQLMQNSAAPSSPIALGAFTSPPSPLPAPTASGYANATLYGVSHPALASHTTYEVDYVSPDTACVHATSGSFTTSDFGAFG